MKCSRPRRTTTRAACCRRPRRSPRLLWRGKSMAEVQFQPLEAPERLADMVYETIRQSIMDKTLAPGARLTESGIAQQLGVSKTPVREALLRLRRIGVIEPDGVRGARVVRRSRSAIREAYEVREALEVFAVRSVAAHVGGTDLERICDAAARSLSLVSPGDPGRC